MASGIAHTPDSPYDLVHENHVDSSGEIIDSVPMGDSENKHEARHHERKNRDNSDHPRAYVVLVGLERFTRILIQPLA